MHINCSYGIFDPFISMGAIAMTAFFMLSGYSLYLSSGSRKLQTLPEIKNFYLKRFIGVFPVYYLTAFLFITMTFAADYLNLQHTDETALQHLLAAPIDLLGLQSVFSGSFNFSHHGGTWFISCIAICYLFYPYLQQIVNMLSEKSKFALIVSLVFILLLSPILQSVMQWSSIYDNPLIRLMEFTIGILLAGLNQHSNLGIMKILRSKWTLVMGVMILFFGVNIAIYLIGRHSYMLYSWIALPAFIMILIPLGKLPFTSLKNSRTIQYLSAISYVFFLAQFFVWNICRLVFNATGYDSNLFRVTLSLAVCFAIAIAMHEMFEKPVAKRLKYKLL